MAELVAKSRRKLNISFDSVRYFLVCIYFLIALFEPYLNGVIGSVTKYYILFLTVILLFRKRHFYFTRFQLAMMGWLLYKAASLLWTTNLYVAGLHVFSQIGAVLLLYALTFCPEDNDKQLMQSITYTIWGGSFTISFLSIFFSRPYMGKLASRQVLNLFGQETDPNNQAALVLLGFSIGLYYLLIARKHRVFSLLTILVSAYSIFLTSSRGGFLGSVLIIIAVILIASMDLAPKQKLKTYLIIILISAALFLISYFFLDREVFNRIFVFSDYEGGSGRDEIWHNAWQLLKEKAHWLYGAGWGAYWGYNNYNVMLHNTFLSILCDTGIIGFLLLMVPIGSTAWKLLRQKQFLPVLLLIAGFSASFFLEAINKRFFWNVIFYLFMYAQYVAFYGTQHTTEVSASDEVAADNPTEVLE